MAAVAFTMTGCAKIDLYSNLSEKEANQMIAILQEFGIETEKLPGEENKFTIKVEKDRFSAAVEKLKARGFPKDSFVGMGDVFKKTGLVSSPVEERIRFMDALSQSLAETITHIDGVLTARVHIVLPNNDPFTETARPSSAAVFVNYRASSDVESAVPRIKNLVINSIEGLAYERVTVALFPSESASDLVPRNADKPVQALFVSVAPQSLTTFWGLLGGLATIALLALGGIGFLWRQNRKLQAKPEAK